MTDKKKILVIQKVHDKGMELIINNPKFEVDVTDDVSIDNLKFWPNFRGLNQIFGKKSNLLKSQSYVFDKTVLQSDKPVLVDFWAAWCGPCRMVGPIIDELSNEYDGKAVIGKVDVDSNQEFAAKYGVRNIPTVLLFKDGELIDRKVGVSPKQVYAEAIDSAL